MNTSAISIAKPVPITRSTTIYRDFCEVVKPRLSLLVLVTVAVGGIVATWGQPAPAALIHAIVATALIATSASVWNQWLERDTDAQMARTAGRPMAAGRMGRWPAFVFGTVALIAGVVDLLLFVNLATASLGLTTWVLYVLIYTPLKRISRWNTLIGAIPGGLPVLIGWAATGQPLDLRAAAMFLIIFFWQFPHFMAIAWKYRDQYAKAGLRMVTVTDPSGRRAGIQAVVGSLALLPVSLVPALVAPPSSIYAVTALVLGCVMLACSLRFLRERDDRSARLLLRASLIYLPGVMIALACLPLTS